MSGARPDTWMPTYWGDYARDTGHLSAVHHGAYLMLIKHYWCSGKPLVDDDSVLWRISTCDSLTQWKKIRPTIAAFFQVEDGTWRHGRVDEELEKAQRFMDRQAANGRRGGRPRNPDKTQKKPKNNPPPNPEHNPDKTTSQPQPPSPSNPNQPPSPGTASAGSAEWARWGLAIKSLMREFWPDDQRVEMAQTGLCEQWRVDGYDLELDVLPAVRAVCDGLTSKGQPPPNGLKYFENPIKRRRADRLAGLPEPSTPQSREQQRNALPPQDPWEARVAHHRAQLDAGKPETATTWADFIHRWGDMPGHKGCQAPLAVQEKHGFIKPKKDAA